MPVDEPKRGRDLDELIKDIADHKRQSDLSELVSNLSTSRLFFSVISPLPPDLPYGERFTVKGERIECRTVSVQGLECALAFTSPTDPRLVPDAVMMMEGLEAFQMLLNTPLDGLLIQSIGTAWVVFDRKQIEQILSPPPKPTFLEGVGRTLARIFKRSR